MGGLNNSWLDASIVLGDSRDELGRRLRDEVRFGVLGPVTVTDGTSALSIGGPKQHTVLAVLIANWDDPVSIDVIIDAVGPSVVQT